MCYGKQERNIGYLLPQKKNHNYHDLYKIAVIVTRGLKGYLIRQTSRLEVVDGIHIVISDGTSLCTSVCLCQENSRLQTHV